MKNHSGHTSLLTKIETFFTHWLLYLWILDVRKWGRYILFCLNCWKFALKLLNAQSKQRLNLHICCMITHLLYQVFMICFEMLRLKNDTDQRTTHLACFITLGDGKIDINLSISNHPIVFSGFIFYNSNTVSLL